VGEDGPTHHGCFDLSFLRLIPGIVVMAPRNENELRDMLYTAIHYNEGPIFIRYPRSHSLGIPLKTDFDLLPVGKGEILKRGKDIAIVGLGTLLNDGLKAGELLEAEGISPTIVDMKFLKPLDLEVLKEIASSHRVLVTVEENAIEGGFGSAILENIITLDNPPRVIRLGLPDRFLEHGPRQMLLNNLDLNARGIADAVKRALTPSV
jgi:1-deoxy-D-xylulose-5-phosphate synthase